MVAHVRILSQVFLEHTSMTIATLESSRNIFLATQHYEFWIRIAFVSTKGLIQIYVLSLNALTTRSSQLRQRTQTSAQDSKKAKIMSNAQGLILGLRAANPWA
jgi:hypothetical protein